MTNPNSHDNPLELQFTKTFTWAFSTTWSLQVIYWKKMTNLKGETMKKFLIGIWIVIFFLNIATHSFAEETIRIAIGEWPPYTSKELKHYGVVSRIVAETFALEGVKVVILLLRSESFLRKNCVWQWSEKRRLPKFLSRTFSWFLL